MARNEIVRDVKIAAPPDAVFSYLTDPEKLRRWQAASADVDLRVGGEFQMVIAGEQVARGSFLEIERPHKLVYTWGWESSGTVPPGATKIEITLEQDGDFTILHFVHSGLPNDEEVTSHTHGWEHYLARLTVAAGGGDPGPDEMKSS
jgi:uncharacterized protein YndB with AHSA1/START domain